MPYIVDLGDEDKIVIIIFVPKYYEIKQVNKMINYQLRVKNWPFSKNFVSRRNIHIIHII